MFLKNICYFVRFERKMPRVNNKRKNSKNISEQKTKKSKVANDDYCGYGDWCEEKQEWQYNGVSTSLLMAYWYTSKSYIESIENENAIENNFDSLDELVVTNTFGDLFPPREVEHDHITRVLPKHEQMRLKEFYSLPENKKKMDDFFAK